MWKFTREFQPRFLFIIHKHPHTYKIIEILKLFYINIYIKIRTVNSDRLYKISEKKIRVINFIEKITKYNLKKNITDDFCNVLAYIIIVT